jgi:hypothetical protein
MTVSHTPPPAGHRIPVFETVGRTFVTCWSLGGALPRVAAWPFALSIVIVVATIELAVSPIVGLVLTVLNLAVYTLFAVAWHRLVLLDDRSASSAPLSWNRRHTVFFGYLVAIYVLFYVVVLSIFLPLVFAAMTAAPAGHDNGVSEGVIVLAAVMVAVAIIIGFYVFFRLSFVFPARAVDEEYGLTESWRHTKGNGLRLIAIALIVNLSVMVPFLILSQWLLVPMIEPSMGDAPARPFLSGSLLLITIISIVIHFLLLALNVTLISLSFRTATGWIPAPQAGPPVAAPGNDEP